MPNMDKPEMSGLGKQMESHSDILEMEPGGGLVQDVEGAAGWPPGQFPAKFDPPAGSAENPGNSG
jgi:hypothetical protein